MDLPQNILPALRIASAQWHDAKSNAGDTTAAIERTILIAVLHTLGEHIAWDTSDDTIEGVVAWFLMT